MLGRSERRFDVLTQFGWGRLSLTRPCEASMQLSQPWRLGG
jgi:hypothetical protein